MNKWHGIIGFIEQRETYPDVYTEVITEKTRYGDINRKVNKWATIQEVNENVAVNNEISVIADDYLLNHSSWIRYIEYLGNFWKVTSITVLYPRIIISLGDVYSGKRAKTVTQSDTSSDNG